MQLTARPKLLLAQQQQQQQQQHRAAHRAPRPDETGGQVDPQVFGHARFVALPLQPG